MNAMLVVIVGIAILVVGYIFYGGWLAKQWGWTTPRSPRPMSWRTAWTTSPPRPPS